MIDLAFDSSGEPFELPATAAFWRVRRFRKTGVRGGPEVVFGHDGSPLILPIDTDLLEFREQVAGVPGRYRLDPLDQKQQPLSDLPAAYLQISEPPKTSSAEDQATVIRELARTNAEMAKTIAEKFASVMQSAADLIRAADGAGLPARTPPVTETRNAAPADEESDEDDDEQPRSELTEIIKQVMPVVQLVVTRMLSGPGSGEIRNTAAAPAGSERPAADCDRPAHGTPAGQPASSGPKDLMANLTAVENALTPAEVDLVRRAMGEMSPELLQAWAAKICALSVEEAVQAVRAEMAKGGGS